MKIAIIGAGFCGLATAWHLLEKGCQVTLFDPRGIGGGASGIATGLMHPYPGEDGRRSWKADEAMAATQELLAIAGIKPQMGILRHLQNEEQRQSFSSHAKTYGDVEERGDFVFITSGMTIPCPRYLQGLWEACARRGACLVEQTVEDVHELRGFDAVIVAAGKGAVDLCPDLKVSRIKGQVLRCRLKQAPAYSLIGKGYVAKGEGQICAVGSTYERNVSEEADPAFAAADILPKVSIYFPEIATAEVLEARAAMRVVRIGHYIPMVGQLDERTWVITAMGSRGLLYHAYFAKLLAAAICGDNLLPKEVQVLKGSWSKTSTR